MRSRMIDLYYLVMEQLLMDKLAEFGKIDTQLGRGMITVREALSQRIRIGCDANALLKQIIKHDLGIDND